MARTRNTGPRSGIGKTTSESERNVPTRAETRGSDPSAVCLGLNRSKVRLNRRTTKTRAATCAASSIWFSMLWLGSQDINRELTAIVLNVAKTPKMASRDALPKTSPTLAFRKDSVILGLFLRAPSSGRPDCDRLAIALRVVALLVFDSRAGVARVATHLP